MVFKIDFIDGEAVSWSKKGRELEVERYSDYRPRFYIEGDISKLQKSRTWLSKKDGVAATKFESWIPGLEGDLEKVLRVDCESNKKLKKTAHRLKRNFGRSTFRFYNVGFSPQFRFCLQKNICPKPDDRLDRLEIRLHRKKISDRELSGIRVDGDYLEGENKEVIEEIAGLWNSKDPDIVIVNRGKILELLRNESERNGIEFIPGRTEGFQKLAGGNTVSSYGKKQHKPSRYNIPGRVLIDRSNSFLLEETTVEGLWDLVERSYRPLQELAWGSIGRILTSIEIRRAYLEENILTPWKNWNGESPKKASKMHKADRGGFIFNPEPGIHENVLEADFASLFPNIMVKKNISPETVCCECCENDRTPELDYSICQRKNGFIGKVLEPLIEDRQRMKEEVRKTEDGEKIDRLEGRIDALKWILVSCFGYMGHSHASFGAIKCHQAIQAFDRDIMMEAKEILEKEGYHILHGIIDSIWVQKDDEVKEFEEICDVISREIGIELEPEERFEWCAFVPRKSSDAMISTLNRYFGKKKDGEIVSAGIESEQRSTSDYVAESQIEMIKAFDQERNPGDVIDTLKSRIEDLSSGEVPVEKLVRTKKTSKSLDSYQVENRTVSAVKRAKKHGIDIKPGQEVSFIVRNDRASSLERTRLRFESEDNYDQDFYIEKLLKAAESVLSPVGLEYEDIKARISERKKMSLKPYR